MNSPVVGILLAAGNSERFGSNKLLHNLDGQSMLIRTAKNLVSVVPESVVIISPQLEFLTNELEQLGLRVVMNWHSERGMGSSIACGVTASPTAAAWLVYLADMPYIKVETMQSLVSRLQSGADLVAPFLGEQRGHPVGFSQRHYDALASLDGDSGARQILHKYENELVRVPTTDKGVLIDIDKKQDLDIIA